MLRHDEPYNGYISRTAKPNVAKFERMSMESENGANGCDRGVCTSRLANIVYTRNKLIRIHGQGFKQHFRANFLVPTALSSQISGKKFFYYLINSCYAFMSEQRLRVVAAAASSSKTSLVYNHAGGRVGTGPMHIERDRYSLQMTNEITAMSDS